MDFGSILQKAQKNETAKREIHYYSTKFEPPKKEQKNKAQISVNVQKFLAKREAEEKQKQQEALKKREELLALRAKDKKATRRVNVMLKRTKSASQSVLEEAVDQNNTDVALAGMSQPDEDDYGYVSQEAAALYAKMMEKYSKMPDDPKFPTDKRKVSTNLSSTKDRVRAALEKEREEAMMPRSRKRKHHEPSSTAEEHPDSPKEEEPMKQEKPKKPKIMPAPVVNFADLLKLAEQKQHEPIIIEKKEKEEERLLTKKQKLEMQREKERLERKQQRLNGAGIQKPVQSSSSDNKLNRIPKLNSGKKPEEENRVPNSKANALANGRIPKVNGNYDDKPKKEDYKNSDRKDVFKKPNDVQKRVSFAPENKDLKRNNSDYSSSKVSNGKEPFKNGYSNHGSSSKISSDSKLHSALTKPASSSNNKPLTSSSGNKQFKSDNRADPFRKDIPPSKNLSSKPNGISTGKPKDLQPKKVLPSDLKPKQFPPSDLKPKQFPPSDMRPKQFPPKDLKPKHFPPGDVRRRDFNDLKKKKMLLQKRRIIDDDDSEYDSEMDDFIDDGPEGEDDYSRYISEIFNYDKSRYRDEDYDDAAMESSFAQQMREEVISAKIGIMEDLEDMKKEEEEKRRKKAALMKMKKKK